MAQQALAIHDLAPTLAPGWSSKPSSYHRADVRPVNEAPLAYLREYVEVRAVFVGGQIDHHGTFFNVVFTSPRTAPIPLLVSALGVKPSGCGRDLRWRDFRMCPVPYLLNKALPALRAGAEAPPTPGSAWWRTCFSL